MASTTFLLQLQNYPKDSINDEMIDFLQPYFAMEDYNMDMARVSFFFNKICFLLLYSINDAKSFSFIIYKKRVCGDVAGF